MIVEIEKIKQTSDDSIDYNYIVFKIQTNKKLTIDNSLELSSLLHALITGGALKIIIDMKKLVMIDSTGIGILINYAKIIRKNEGNMVLCNVISDIQETLNVINLEKFIKIYNSDVESVNSFRYL